MYGAGAVGLTMSPFMSSVTSQGGYDVNFSRRLWHALKCPLYLTVFFCEWDANEMRTIAGLGKT